MSRIGKKIITLPEGVTVTDNKGEVTVKGPKGEFIQTIDPEFVIEYGENELKVLRPTEQKRHRALHGLYRSLINNAVVGVTEGYKLSLEFVGVGYKADVKGSVLEMALGYSHNIFMGIPPEVKVVAETAKGKNPLVHLESNDKQLIGQVAAKLRSLRKVEPYKGKGVRFVGENVRRKAGKTAAK